jgi:3-hydroxyisobutyrate dehydrogenase-like beta-hydroxyacid dehydrogenase
MKTPSVGWIGLGKMGLPMALNLLAAGHELTVYNRSGGKAQALLEQGARHVTRLDELGQADMVFSMIADDAALHDVTIGAEGCFAHLRPGVVFVDMSTVSPELSQQVAQRAEDVGIRYLRAPVSGSTPAAAAGKLTILASGAADAYEAASPLLARLGEKVYYLGTGDQARFLKLAINLMVGVSAAMLGEALVLARKGGVDWAQAIEVIGHSAVASPLVKYKERMLTERDFTPMFTASQMAKDLDLALDAGRLSGVPLPVVSLVRQFFGAMQTTQRGEQDFFSYLTLMEELAGLSN